MKKRIFISMQYMEIGGAERSLLGLLNAIDYTRFDVDLFIYRHTGEFMPLIPKEVNLLPEIPSYTALARPMKQILKEWHWGIFMGRLWAKLKANRFAARIKDGVDDYAIFHYIGEYTTPFLPNIMPKVTYDLAISFLTPHHVVRDKVRAKKKIAWIHTDYSSIGIDVKSEEKVWHSFDYIASISKNVTDGFLKRFPHLDTKIVLIENILSSDFVRQQADLDIVRYEGVVNILTVGRFCYPKAIDNAVRICKQLVDRGLPVKWYAIGYGDEETVRKAIMECGMETHFQILGKKSNPYPYIKACDIYIQPSRYEGKAVTVREAQILCKPVVITAFPTAKSQLEDGFDGVIVPMDIEKAANEIQALLLDKKRQEQLILNMLSSDYGNISEVRKIYDLL